MKILYIHGFGSKFDPESPKIKSLEKLGTVHGVDLDYTQGYLPCIQEVMRVVYSQKIDLIVGTSMGGYMANMAGVGTGIKFVSINPARDPAVALRKYLGTHVDHYGREFTLEESKLEDYGPFVLDSNAHGLVLLDEADEVINSHLTQRLTQDVYPTHMFPGGSHRFEHMEEALLLIKE